MLEKLIRVFTIDRYIRCENTGNSYDFAQKLGTSRTVLFEFFAALRDLGAVIRYDRSRQTFYYANEFEMKITVYSDGRKVLSNDDMSGICGGGTLLCNEITVGMSTLSISAF